MTLMEAHGMQKVVTALRNRRGRKRKSGRRLACGRLAPVEDVMAVVLNQPHRRDLPIEQRKDQKAESHLGRLSLRGIITEAEYLAGKKYAMIVKRYRSVISAADPTMKPVAGMGYDIPPSEAARRKEAYDRAYEAMYAAGQRSQHAVARVAVYAEPCPIDRHEDLKRGLACLVRHFGLTNHSGVESIPK